jgi:hypothetical protein
MDRIVSRIPMRDGGDGEQSASIRVGKAIPVQPRASLNLERCELGSLDYAAIASPPRSFKARVRASSANVRDRLAPSAGKLSALFGRRDLN